MKSLIFPILILIGMCATSSIHSASAETKTKTVVNTPQNGSKKSPQINPIKIAQPSNLELSQSIASLTAQFDELPSVCQKETPLAQQAQEFQQRLVAIKDQLQKIKENFVIRDPSIHSYVHTLYFYLNQPGGFNYEREIPENGEELKEHVSGLALSFRYMYQLAFNIPESTPMNEFPEGWGRSVGSALTCLKNHQ